MNNCVFCQPLKELVFLETNNFYILYDPYPVVIGHIMLTSKKHFGCLGELTEEIFFELEELDLYCSNLIQNKYGLVTSYEHGRAGSCSLGSSDGCHHFHLHFLPIKGSFESLIAYNSIRLKDHKEIKGYYSSYGNYLYLKNHANKRFFYPVHFQEVPNHYLRTLAAQEIGCFENADWTKYKSMDLMMNTKHDLSIVDGY
jgi:diadenosine tetraphosphate (Ap4A) HIT family hydrolase